MIGVPSRLRLIRKADALTRVRSTFFWAVDRTPRGGSGTDHWQIALTELLKMEQKRGQFPDESVRIKV